MMTLCFVRVGRTLFWDLMSPMRPFVYIVLLIYSDSDTMEKLGYILITYYLTRFTKWLFRYLRHILSRNKLLAIGTWLISWIVKGLFSSICARVTYHLGYSLSHKLLQ